MRALRALRAVPALQQVRLASHARVTEAQWELLAQALPQADAADLRLVSRIVVDLVYSMVEMLFDEPLDARAVAPVVVGMLAGYLPQVRGAAGRAGPRRRPRSG